MQIETRPSDKVIAKSRIRLLFDQPLRIFQSFLIVFVSERTLRHICQDGSLVIGKFQGFLISLCHLVLLTKLLIEVGHATVHFVFSLFAGDVFLAVFRQFIDRYDQIFYRIDSFDIFLVEVGQVGSDVVIIKSRHLFLGQ